ncbi:HAMP domain-containing sensor histidine kinase [Nocardioides sp. T2.26MG-1]|uniref:HAMP domain-containing sensor histidine kinase n=1 Tax=Nocardioides sp. T2.26MG-1 TaxID=3041166 RepID=UPI0024778E79|nr:ATP-binding protein [Nocardioides sp. T2.26MG-1]CAI9403846.1 Adaptive-response sensory-kinase SasA [Nocardioides sp. T2.26MG-1]
MSAGATAHPADGPSLAVRVLIAIGLVVLAGAVTLLVVALLVGPTAFHRHLDAAGVELDGATLDHVNDGFQWAMATAIAAGVTAATAVAVAVATFVARRVSRPVSQAAAAATRLADGDYAARVAEPGVGPELGGLSRAINRLADRLETSEAHREALLTDIAHELRTPLSAVEATVEAIADGVLPADEETLTALRAQTQRLLSLTRDLAALSRSDEHAFRVDRRPLDLAAVARSAVAAHAARYAAGGVTLALEVPATPCPAHGDAGRVGEVVDQLLDNALRQCRPGDTVTVRARTAAGGPGEGAEIAVADTGAGFPPELAEQLFERFYRLAPASSGGSGVGLTIARALVEAQGGTLSAASAGPGRGAVLTLRLPDDRPG